MAFMALGDNNRELRGKDDTRIEVNTPTIKRTLLWELAVVADVGGLFGSYSSWFANKARRGSGSLSKPLSYVVLSWVGIENKDCRATAIRKTGPLDFSDFSLVFRCGQEE